MAKISHLHNFIDSELEKAFSSFGPNICPLHFQLPAAIGHIKIFITPSKNANFEVLKKHNSTFTPAQKGTRVLVQNAHLLEENQVKIFPYNILSLEMVTICLGLPSRLSLNMAS